MAKKSPKHRYDTAYVAAGFEDHAQIVDAAAGKLEDVREDFAVVL